MHRMNLWEDKNQKHRWNTGSCSGNAMLAREPAALPAQPTSPQAQAGGTIPAV